MTKETKVAIRELLGGALDLGVVSSDILEAREELLVYLASEGEGSDIAEVTRKLIVARDLLDLVIGKVEYEEYTLEALDSGEVEDRTLLYAKYLKRVVR